jgi:two-component system, chemotaxis family, protein-glutamate methylesterase/glutaminase
VSGLPKKRVLIVDDAVVVRKILSDAIARNPDLEVAGTASNGRIALAQFLRAKPDIVLLDIEMPEMNGLETVAELRKMDAHVPIIMFSTLTEKGAAATFDALALGATDYVAKPSNSDMGSTADKVLHELIPKIRALCRLPESPPLALKESKQPVPSVRTEPRMTYRKPAEIIAIGVSTGGPDALARVMPLLPASLSVPIVIAQHMPHAFTKMLAARLSRNSPLPVRECEPGERITPGCAFLAPGDLHMVVQSNGTGTVHLQTHRGPKENFCRPSVDVLFRSVANTYGSRTLAVVLTGMGHDGLKGCELLHEKGARIVVQDEMTSVVWGMPGYVARAGLADKILPLDQIGLEIVRSTTRQLAAGT